MFKPLHQLVTVILDPKNDKTKGGLVLPDCAGASHVTGTVRAAGPEAGYKIGEQRFELRPGDRIIIGNQKVKGMTVNFGTITDEDGIEVALVNYADIWGTLSKPEEPDLRLADN
jgi:co-chaperonin GroES (HSP10)